MSGRLDELNRLKLGEFPALYKTLKPPVVSTLDGKFQGAFVGPSWLRRIAGPGLIVTGLGGWWGKHFKGDGNAVNLVMRNEAIKEVFPMTLVSGTSLIDGLPVLRLHYESDNPFPWPHIVDELRQIEPGLVLGMTFIKAIMFRGLVLPFTLQYQEQIDGL